MIDLRSLRRRVGPLSVRVVAIAVIYAATLQLCSLLAPYYGTTSLTPLVLTLWLVGWWLGRWPGLALGVILPVVSREIFTQVEAWAIYSPAYIVGPGALVGGAVGWVAGALRQAIGDSRLAAARQQFARDILSLVVEDRPLAFTLDELVQRTGRELPGHACALLCVDADASALELRAAVQLSSEAVAQLRSVPLDGSSLLARAATTGDTVIGMRRDSAQQPAGAVSQWEAGGTPWAVPILGSEPRPMGVVAVVSAEGRPTPHAKAVIEETAKVAGLALERDGHRKSRIGLEDALLVAQKTESLSLLAGGVAHDFNNLMQVVLGASEILSKRIDAQELTPLVAQIEDAAGKAAALADQMLVYAGRRPSKIEIYDLSELARGMQALLEVTPPKQVEFVLDLADDLPRIAGSPTQASEILMNLVTNAAEAIGDEGGRIVVRTMRLAQRAEFRAADPSSDSPGDGRDGVVLEVEDTGCGFGKELERRLFDPFFTTKFKGRGLGLATVLGCVRSHGGTIHVTSTPGLGSRFTVVIPEASADARMSSARGAKRAGRGSVLVVQDAEGNDREIRDQLQTLGFDAFVAANARDGVRLATDNGDRLAAVLLDGDMTEMNGVEALEAILEGQPDMRVVLMSSDASPELPLTSSRRDGSALIAHLPKPHTLDSLRSALQVVTE